MFYTFAVIPNKFAIMPHKLPLKENTNKLTQKVKSSHIYLYSAFHNTDCIKAASQ